MKKKILFLTVVVAVGAAWFVLANKFEKTVVEQYLPHLKAEKEKGLIDFDENNIKIEKYRFKIVMNDLSIHMYGKDFVKIDQISACYNPLTNMISIYPSGKKISIGSAYLLSPSSISVKINSPVLAGDMDNVDISVSSKGLELLNSSDDLVVLALDEFLVKLTGTLDKKTNQYSAKLDVTSKDTSTKRLEHVQNILSSLEHKEFIENYINIATFEYYDNLSKLFGPLDHKFDFTLTANKEHFKTISKIISEAKSDNLFSDFGDKISSEIFSISGNHLYGNDKVSNKMSFNISGDGNDIKGNIDLNDKTNYPENKIPELVTIMSEYLEKTVNKEATKHNHVGNTLAAEDFKILAQYLTKIKKSHFGTNFSYNIANSGFDGDLNFTINDYTMDLIANGGDNKPYTGMLKLSDPAKLIHVHKKLVETIMPLTEKFGMNREHFIKLQKFASNIDNNGLAALMVLNANQDPKEGDKFESNFTFQPKNFEFKVNDQSFLKILTDERMVKFLKGLEGIRDISSESVLIEQPTVTK